MQKVYILVSTFMDEELDEPVIYRVLGVFASKESANYSLSCLKSKSILDLEILEEELIP